MHLRQHYLRYLYIGAFVVLLLGAGVGRLAWMRFVSHQGSAVHQIETVSGTPMASGQATATVTPHSNSGHSSVLTPTPRPGSKPAPMPTSAVAIHTDAAVHLLIPKIGVDAPIEMVGLDSLGRMEVPTKSQWSDVGWYRNGTIPGAMGSAVIDGHLDTNTGAPAVFWKLNALSVGDMVTVQDGAGRKAQFRVFKLQNYSINQAPLDQIFARKDGVYLNLITCAGSWDYSQNQFQQRLVVFTQLV